MQTPQEFLVPSGWQVAEYSEKNAEYVAPGPQTGEDDYHSQYVDPDSKFGAANVKLDKTTSYENTGSDRDEPEGDASKGVGQVNLEPGEAVVEDGEQNYRNYYLVRNEEEDKYFVVVPQAKDGEGDTEYRGPKRTTRVDALQDAYRILNANLPKSMLAQLRMRVPESEVVEDL